ALVQHRDRDRPARRSVCLRPGACPAVPRCNVRTDGDHRGIRDHRPYGLALDDRPCRCAVENPLAATDGGGADDPGAMDPCRGPRGWCCKAARQLDRAQMARAYPARRKPGRRLNTAVSAATLPQIGRALARFGHVDVKMATRHIAISILTKSYCILQAV